MLPSRSGRRRIEFLTVLLLSLLGGRVVAETTGRIVGRLTDESGAPVAAVRVTATNAALDLAREVTSNDDGEFVLALLPTGEYQVAFEAAGWQPKIFRFTLGLGESVPLDVRMEPGEVISEEILVTGDQSAMETTTVSESFRYDDQVEQLPLIDRTLDGVAQYAPNVAIGPTGDIAISGAPSFDTMVMLDGAEISDPYFGGAPVVYIEDAIEEVQILTSGVSARYGRFQGGVVNAVTKSGSNEFAGALRLELSNQSWNSTTPFGEEQTDDVSKVYQASLGGYLVKDHLWFFASGRTFPTRSESLTTEFTGEEVVQSTEQDRYQGKLRAAPRANHLFNLNYLKFDETTINDDGLPAGDDRAVGARNDPRETWAASYQGILDDRTYLEVGATRKRVSIGLGGAVANGDPFLDLVNFVVYNNSWWDIDDPSVRDNETASVSLNHGLGAHDFEVGVQYVNSITGGENRQSSTGFNLLAFNDDFVSRTVAGEPRYNLRSFGAVRWEALPLGGEQKVENTALYLQDTFSAGRWRFDLGARYERYTGDGPVPLLNVDFSGLAPRLGATFSVRPSLQVQASYGHYISRLNDQYVGSVTTVGGAPRIETFYFGPDLLDATGAQVSAALRNDEFWPLVTGYIAPASQTSYLATDLSAPYAEEWNLSLRQALPRSTGSVVLSYVSRDYRDLIDDFQGGACDFGIDFGQPCPAGSVTVVPGDIPVDTTIWANSSAARREYQAFTALVDYRPNASWQFGGNYTFGKTRGNYEGEAQNQPASGSPFGNYQRAIDVAAATPFGYLSTDVRHRAFLYGNYQRELGRRGGSLSLGSVLFYRSGLAYSLAALVDRQEVDEYVAEAGQYTHFFGERGSQRADGFWRLDLSTRYELPLAGDLRLFAKASVLNVLDNDAVIDFNTAGVAVRDASGQLTWRPSAPRSGVDPISGRPIVPCGPGDEPATNCSGFGRIRSQDDYQDPRTFLLTFGLTF